MMGVGGGRGGGSGGGGWGGGGGVGGVPWRLHAHGSGLGGRGVVHNLTSL